MSNQIRTPGKTNITEVFLKWKTHMTDHRLIALFDAFCLLKQSILDLEKSQTPRGELFIFKYFQDQTQIPVNMDAFKHLY